MPIHVLDAYTAAQIAAGEVIERPASVVKELVENALDAGATEIRVEVREGGKREIKIVDNGSGIPADEVELAFQRHATSKLNKADDLFNIHTLGFRGEALPSIATVAQVTCTTRTADAPTGVEVRVAGTEFQGRVPRGGMPGTSFVIKNLFYNAPVRLKFLRSDASEAAQITAVVQHYALAYPHVRWTLLVDGRLALQTPGNGQLLDAIVEMYGLDIARQLIPVEDKAGSGDQATRVHGYISQPTLHRSARSSIHLFVNRRWVQARGQLAFVLEEAYHTLLMKGRHPLAVLHIEVEPEAVDVNVHPTKSEVKFLYQPQVYALIGRAVRAALSEYTDIQPLEIGPTSAAETVQRRIELRQIGTRAGSERSLAPWEPPAPPSADEDEMASPVAMDDDAWESATFAPPAPRSDAERDAPYEPPRRTASEGFAAASRPRDERASSPVAPVRGEQPSLGIAGYGDTSPAPRAEGGQPKLPPLRVVGQVGEMYIVAEAPDGMYLVDQHAAHERVVYERLMRTQGEQPLESQNLLLPVPLDLAPSAMTLLVGHLEELATWGFRIEADEDGGLTVKAVPAGLLEGEIGPALLELVDHIEQAGGSTPTDWREQALTTVACHSAIRAGQTLSHEEMRQLLQQLERCAMPRTCPHGRPTTLTLSQTQLERQFGRKG
jgi:DNA mismatch repair protein MutL